MNFGIAPLVAVAPNISRDMTEEGAALFVLVLITLFLVIPTGWFLYKSGSAIMSRMAGRPIQIFPANEAHTATAAVLEVLTLLFCGLGFLFGSTLIVVGAGLLRTGI
ncbi:hypothetical protein [Phenylobacterium sp.]|uniref:hypothetical protein n=1 Tax=Phenylobacterium sp. TaxID=1871053 RepID=UPI002731383E|nr:hypothetical protein [Phenylobacterium sp.]MDP1599044.1 hypothetical protein [Phenylobacterium sp.]MDP3590472.1 hypothetical protein [Phenylobacterium sp.]